MRDESQPWRSLEDLAPGGPPPAAGEFAPGAVERPDVMMRRTFLKLLGATAGLAGLTACTAELPGQIVPYARRAPESHPGVSLHYATSLVLDGYATGVVVTSRDGRPIKVEGNPEHPASLGGAGVHEQAAVLSLYDPCRPRTVRRGREPASWLAFRQTFGDVAARGKGKARAGEGLHFLLEPTSSPLVERLVARLRETWPGVTVHWDAPLASPTPWEATRALFGRPLAAQLDLRRATTVLALDSDFLVSGPDALRHARHFAERRKPRAAGREMSRLYVVEPAPTPTGASADHRLARRASEVERLAAAVLAEVALGGEPGLVRLPEGVRALLGKLRADERDARFVRAVARDLVRHAGEAVVVAGERQTAAVHLCVALLNVLLGGVGKTVTYTRPALLEAGAPSHGLAGLARAIEAGAVETLVIVDANPVYTAPADLRFVELLRKVPTTVHAGLHENETARECLWFVPRAHDLETWGDARAHDGTASIVQPLVAPLFAGKTVGEVLAAFLPEGEKDARELLRDSWRERVGEGFEAAWEKALGSGVVEGSAFPAVAVELRGDGLRGVLERVVGGAGVGAGAGAGAGAAAAAVEVVFARDHAVHDGRFANNAWLLELPDPVTKLTWDKAALVSPATAARLGVVGEDVVEVRVGERSVRAPLFVCPGHADDALTLPLGYGRDGAEAVARGLGFNAYVLRAAATPYFARGARVSRVFEGTGALFPPAELPARHALASTQTHGRLEGKDVVPSATFEQFRKNPGFAREASGRKLSLYPAPAKTGNQWGMTIDLSLCNGCNACVVACQAENNVPVVGKAGVQQGRAMHWMRLDRYFKGNPEEPEVAFQPMLCQHCEKAPCEYVCPTNATTHSPDGLNEQTYNRCIGTRFCSNNCAWKVRRFNWFNYQGGKAEIEKLAMNPDVTVRERGVMEKCTFCVQRIRGAEVRAAGEGRELRDGEVRTACQQACPASAIVFGSIADPAAAVVAERADPRRYEVLGELGTGPRVQYLARVTNPNPELLS